MIEYISKQKLQTQRITVVCTTFPKKDQPTRDNKQRKDNQGQKHSMDVSDRNKKNIPVNLVVKVEIRIWSPGLRAESSQK